MVDQDQPDSLTLRYTPTPVQSSRFDLYRFRISDGVNTTQERIVNDTDTKVTFTGLTPGRLYNVTVWTVSDQVESRPLLRQDRLCMYTFFYKYSRKKVKREMGKLLFIEKLFKLSYRADKALYCFLGKKKCWFFYFFTYF